MNSCKALTGIYVTNITVGMKKAMSQLRHLQDLMIIIRL